MGGDGPRNGPTRDGRIRDRSPRGGSPRAGAPPGAVPDPSDPFDLIARRTRAALAASVAGGALPAGLDLGRFAVAPPRRGLAGDAVVDAGLVYAPDAGPNAARLVAALAEGLRGAPEVEAVAVAGAGLLVVTLRRGAVSAAVRAVLLRGPGEVPSPSSIPPERGGVSLARARAEVAARQRAALASAAGRGGGEGEAGLPLPLPPVFVRGGPRGASPAALSDRDALVWIGADAFRFAVASCRADAALHLDLDTLGDRCRADPCFWTRYAHARARAMLRRAAAAAPEVSLRPTDLAAADFAALTDAGAARLADLVARHASTVAGGSPRRLAAHLVEVAEAVHRQWSDSKEQPQLRFVNEELREMAEARFGLVTAAALVLRSGLDILGIAAPDEMP